MELEPPDFTRLRLAFRDDSHGDAVRALERARARGELESLRVGVLRPTPPPLKEIEGDERYRESRRRFLDIIAAVGLTRRSPPVVFSHRSALAILGMPTVNAWGDVVDVVEPQTSARRSKHGIRVHRTGFLPDEIMPWGPFFVTTPARTIADVARSGDFMSTVVALDAALRPTTRSLLRLSKSDVTAVLSRHGEWGLARAESAVQFADGRAANAGESASRVVIYQLGFEVPDLQVRHFHSEGYYDVDFKWRRRAGMLRPLIGEFDGAGKYVKPEYLGSMTSGEAVVKEKRREDILRRQDNDFGRWGWSEVRRPIDLDRILRECGLRPVRRRLI